jgi:hypothetical protein
VSACCYRWRASRVEVHTAPVEHVCNRERGHSSDAVMAIHRCSCGAEVETVWRPEFDFIADNAKRPPGD